VSLKDFEKMDSEMQIPGWGYCCIQIRNIKFIGVIRNLLDNIERSLLETGEVIETGMLSLDDISEYIDICEIGEETS
jgi:hypothetical protein